MGPGTHSRITTTRTACTAPSTAPRRRDAPAHHPHRPRALLFANMLGRSIVAVCFTHRFQPEHEFATYRVKPGFRLNLNKSG